MKGGHPIPSGPINPPSRGFTLLELLISVTLIALMVVILTVVLRLGYRSLEAGEKKTESLERLRTSFHIIESQVHSEIPLTHEENGEKRLYFQGKADRLDFATPVSIWGGERGVVAVSYRIEEESGGTKRLVAVENKMGQAESRDITLLNAFERMDFAYFSQAPTEASGQWVEEWTDTASLPRKIRLHLVKDGKDLSLLLPIKTPVTSGPALVSPPQGAGR